MESTCLQERKAAPVEPLRLNILFLYDQQRAEDSNTYEHLRSFRLLSRHNVFYTHEIQQPLPPAWLDPFDVVALHYSLTQRDGPWLSPACAATLAKYPGLKVLFLQDDYTKPTVASEWCKRLGISVAFTTTSGEVQRFAYPQLDRDRVKTVTVAPRYQPLGIAADTSNLPRFEQLVRAFDDAVQGRLHRRRRYEITSAVLTATDTRGCTEALDKAYIYTEPVNSIKAPLVSTRGPSAHALALCQGRLTTQPGTPISAHNTAEATAIYFTPYHGNRVALFNGGSWEPLPFREVSLMLTQVHANTNYDVFIESVDNHLALALTAWADDRTRRTPLALHDGIWVHGDDPTRRFVGTLRGSAYQKTEDSLAKRFVWNCANQVPKHLYAGDMTEHGYASAVARHWNDDPAMNFGFVLGLPQELQVQCNAILKANAAGEPALLYPTLDGTLEIWPELGRYLGNYNACFIGTATSGSKMLEPGYHAIGAAESSGPGGAVFANVWLHGSMLC
jgi:hypothetical protein